MAIKKPVTLEAPMMRFTMGYGNEFIVPWEDGIAMLHCLKDVHFVTSKYEEGKVNWYLRERGDLTTNLFTPAEQAQLLMNGTEEAAS